LVADKVLGWQAIGGSEVVLSRTDNNPISTWAGRLTLPPADGGLRRLVITEEEHLASGDPAAVAENLAGRIIYIDALELPPSH
jgi:hypothetical protein